MNITMHDYYQPLNIKSMHSIHLKHLDNTHVQTEILQKRPILFLIANID